MSTKPITISHVYPPIPDRNFDYCAFIEGTEELLQYGWGATPALAAADLIDRTETGFFINQPLPTDDGN